MCGFWGLVTKHPYREFGEAMTNAAASLRRRGADSTNSISGENYCFVHSRLNLSGDSNGGIQPVNLDTKVVVYNGELYNKNELIERFGLTKNQSDTRILSILLATKTLSDITPHLNGMYAIAVYDIQAQKVEMAVDTYGQKPLFYRITQNGIVLGSQAITVRDSKKSSHRIDQLAFYLNFGFCNPSSSFFESVERIQPGEVVTVNLKNLEVERKRYKKVIKQRNASHDAFSSLITEYVDSPFATGVTLSGGIDSSLVAYYYKMAYAGDAVAFTVDIEDTAFSETAEASFFARKLGIRHKIIPISSSELLGLWSSGVEVLDEPNSDSALITTTALMKGAAGDVKCLLSGDGGDELFIGYNRHKLAYLQSFPLLSSFSKYLAGSLENYPRTTKQILSLLAPATTAGEFNLRLKSLVRTLRADNLWGSYVRSLAIDENFVDLCNSFENQILKNYSSKNKLYENFDRYFYLVGNNLTRMDKISLAHNIEARAPLLDDSLQPQCISNTRFQSKPLLRQIHRSIYGPTNLPKKGFSHPVNSLLLNKHYMDYVCYGADIVKSIFGSQMDLELGLINSRRSLNLASLAAWYQNN
jgi:asparagine synthase (glutamine-hydrolysing)